MKTKQKDSLWTRDFTIITVGSVISMFGNSLSGFAMSLLVLDYTDSSMLFALYIVMFTLPQVIMPVVSGALLDRFSRKKTIYTLDFISAGMYLLVGILLRRGWFSFPLFAVYIFIVGSINSIYFVAFDSFYPLLITEGNFQRAYSIASVLETLSNIMVPVSAIIYRTLGISPLLMINALCF
ncbi:MAG: MFS transporter, partial [Eubacteriaceae bacterium]|nr:MFS transporter [Eubacteriaceae bacterium]